ncbi:MAG: DivIVA domain-containing protein [Planctomycetota bacterium]|nr:cell division protein DivIVA [Deltaproteobacteria bacterium]MDP6540756.1 DivIVA domain-containing protein [Planctomycetota bacterium]
MKLTPLDIQKHTFSQRMRGADPIEVEAFLQLVSEDYEALLRERDRLQERLQQLEARNQELTQNEKMLQDTLVTAQGLSEDLKKTAMREAEIRVTEAELQAEKILEASHRRAARIAEDIREMKALRGRLSAALRQTLETHLALVETISAVEETDDEAEGKVAYLASASSRRISES